MEWLNFTTTDGATSNWNDFSGVGCQKSSKTNVFFYLFCQLYQCYFTYLRIVFMLYVIKLSFWMYQFRANVRECWLFHLCVWMWVCMRCNAIKSNLTVQRVGSKRIQRCRKTLFSSSSLSCPFIERCIETHTHTHWLNSI